MLRADGRWAHHPPSTHYAPTPVLDAGATALIAKCQGSGAGQTEPVIDLFEQQHAADCPLQAVGRGCRRRSRHRQRIALERFGFSPVFSLAHLRYVELFQGEQRTTCYLAMSAWEAGPDFAWMLAIGGREVQKIDGAASGPSRIRQASIANTLAHG